MADLQLNKPLYKSDDDADFVPPTPRQPRSHVLGRAAALFLDVMLLHLVFGGIVRFVPQVPLSLGFAAPWLGLALGYCYFGLGFSQLTLGRTLGKLITRVQVCDISGPDLTVGRAFFRAALLLWPLPIHLMLTMVAEKAAAADPTSPLTSVEVFGSMLIVGWVLGNAVFAAFDPYKRTLIDRLAHSIVINAELEAEPTAAYLAEAREADARPPLKASIMALGIALTMCMAFATAQAMAVMRELRDLTADERSRARAMVLPGYGKAMPAPPLNENTTTETVAVAFHFRKRTPLDISTLRSDPVTTATLERMISDTFGPEFYEDMGKYLAATNLERGKRGELPMAPPSKLHFELSFAEYADMFFAKESHPVYTLSRDVDIPSTATVASTSSPRSETNADSRDASATLAPAANVAESTQTR